MGQRMGQKDPAERPERQRLLPLAFWPCSRRWLGLVQAIGGPGTLLLPLAVSRSIFAAPHRFFMLPPILEIVAEQKLMQSQARDRRWRSCTLLGTPRRGGLGTLRNPQADVVLESFVRFLAHRAEPLAK